MIASDTMTHGALVNQVSGIVSATSPTGTGGGAFKNGVVTSYGPDGQEQASVGKVNFENVQYAADGSITGGHILQSTATPEGKPINSSTIHLAPGGKPSLAETQIHNKNDAGVAKVLSTDFSAVKWTDSGKVGSGEVRVATKDPVTGALRSSGTMVFQKEKLASGSVTQYSATDQKAIDSLTELDYTGVTFQGMKVMGGQMKVTRKTPTQAVSSNSQVDFAENGLGRVKQVQTANLDAASGAVKSNVTADYSAVSFNARNEISSGALAVHVTDPNQNPQSHSIVSFANAVPASVQSWRFQDGRLAAKIVTDYSNAKFDNNNHVINSSAKVDVYDGNERLVSSTNVAYDQNGAVVNKQTQTVPVAAAAGPAKTYADLVPVWNSLVAKTSQSSAGAKPASAPAQADAQKPAAPPVTKNTFRSDGTLETSVATTSQNGVPVSAEVTHYDTDGKTVVGTHHFDFTKVVMVKGQAKPSGSIAVREFTAGKTLHSESVFNYG